MMYVRVLLPPSRKFMVALAVLAAVGALGAVGAASALSVAAPTVSHTGEPVSSTAITTDAPAGEPRTHGGCGGHHHWF